MFDFGFGKQLKLHRERLGFSQSELARKAGVTPAAISSLESLKRNPTLNVAIKIIEALEMTTHDFLGEKTKPLKKLFKKEELKARFIWKLEELQENDLQLVEQIINRLRK